MADNKVNFLRGTSAEYEAKTKDNDTFYYTTDTKKLYLGENEVGNGIDPKVIQAHIDNQTIHAKVWRGTQEEYNAIEPKEDDTVYIIKDSDNTLADKLIDDTSTTATDKTWSAKKINENDEVARTAINAHSGNEEIHVTAEEKATWSAKAGLSDIPTELPANGGNADTLDGFHANEIASKSNLLINSWFGSGVVNQRGQTTYPAVSGTSNTIDCWRTVDELGLTVNDGFITLSNGDSLWHKYFNQSVEGLKRFAGQEVTISAKVRCSTGDYYLAGGKHIDTGSEWQIVSHTFTVYESDDLTTIYGGYGVSGSIDVMWIKLELGSIATPFCPPNPALELEKCQRYYQIRSIGDIPAVDLRPSMRTTPTVTQLADGNYAYSAEL